MAVKCGSRRNQNKFNENAMYIERNAQNKQRKDGDGIVDGDIWTSPISTNNTRVIGKINSVSMASSEEQPPSPVFIEGDIDTHIQRLGIALSVCDGNNANNGNNNGNKIFIKEDDDELSSDSDDGYPVTKGGMQFGNDLGNGVAAQDVMMDDIINHMATPNGNDNYHNNHIQMVNNPTHNITHLNPSIYSEGKHKLSINSHYSEGNHRQNNNNHDQKDNKSVIDDDIDIIAEVDEEFAETLGNDDIDDILIIDDDDIDDIQNNDNDKTDGRESFVIKGNDEIFLDETLGKDIADLIDNEEPEIDDEDLANEIINELNNTPQHPPISNNNHHNNDDYDDDIDSVNEHITIG